MFFSIAFEIRKLLHLEKAQHARLSHHLLRMSGLPPSDGAVLYGLPAFWVPDAFQSRVIYIQVLPAITTMARMRTDVTISERVAPPGALPVGSRISRTPREHHSLRTPIHRMM